MSDNIRLVSDNPDAPVIEQSPGATIITFTPDDVETLRQRKLVRENEESIDLPPPAPGEERIGPLTVAERALYTEMVVLSHEIQEMNRELTALSLDTFANSVRATLTPIEAVKEFEKRFGQNAFPTAEDAEQYFALCTHHEYVKAYFNYCLRERFGHTNVYGVRSNFIVYRVESKYKSISG